MPSERVAVTSLRTSAPPSEWPMTVMSRVSPLSAIRARGATAVPPEPKLALVAKLAEAVRLLEDDALGGGGSRGSGRVSFSKLRLVWRGRDHYAKGAAEKEIAAGAALGVIQAAVADSAFSFLREES